MDGEFFAARPDETDDALVAHGPLERLPTARRFDDVVGRIDLSRQADSGGAGLLGIPTQLKDALIDAERLDAVAARSQRPGRPTPPSATRRRGRRQGRRPALVGRRHAPDHEQRHE